MALQRAANDPAGIHRATVSAALIDDYRTELRTIETVSRALNDHRAHRQLHASEAECLKVGSTTAHPKNTIHP
jgi:hypothetical protein